jgi:hypothetical protein
MAGTQKVRTSVRTEFAGLHPGSMKTAGEEKSMLARVCGRVDAEKREIGHGGGWWPKEKGVS